jgi:UDP-N-acetylglucosamine diphosphorylase/glucosamine-1-phosphate N-acetyltransferase
MFSQIVFIDLPVAHRRLWPLTVSRPIAELRTGIWRIREKWAFHFPDIPISWLTVNYLTDFFPLKPTQGSVMYIGGGVLPNPQLLQDIQQLTLGESLWAADYPVAFHAPHLYTAVDKVLEAASLRALPYDYTLIIRGLTDIFTLNRMAIEADVAAIRQQRRSVMLTDKHTVVYAADNIFIEAGAIIKAAVLNAETGIIYIGKNAVVGEGSLIRGAFALCEGAQLNMGAVIRGDTTVGNYCKAGGEISNSVFLGYSNKAHEGFLGNSVIGEYCNLGAGTTASNMKNTMGNINIWNYAVNQFEIAERQFGGLFLGDYSFTGIGTTFNTATIGGPVMNLFDTGLPPKFIPPFTWGTPAQLQAYQLDTFIQTAARMKASKGQSWTSTDEALWRSIFQQTIDYQIKSV